MGFMAKHDTPYNPGTTSVSLLERLKSQDEAAWERFVVVYGPLVMHWIRRRLRELDLDGDHRHDISQNVFATVHRYIGDFGRQRKASFRKWLRQLTDSRTVDYLRSKPQIERTFTETELDALHRRAENLDDSEADHEEEQSILFQAIIASIKKDREPNTVRIMEETMIGNRSDAEVAAELGMTANAVKQARARIKKSIRDEFGDMLSEG